MAVVRRAPDLDRRVSSLPSPQESSSLAGPEHGAYLDDRGECGDAGIIDLQSEQSLRDGQMAGT